MMISILLVDGRGFSEFGKRFLAELLKTIAILWLPLTIAVAPPSGSLASPCGLGVNLATQMQRDQPLDIRHVVKRASHIAMPRIALPIERYGGGEAADAVRMAAPAAGDAAVGRVNVAQS